MHRFNAKMVVLATGGYGRAYFSPRLPTHAPVMARAWSLVQGLPLQDMEFVQFHPTGIYGSGCLITEGARGEGGYFVQLRRANGLWSVMRQLTKTSHPVMCFALHDDGN